MKTSEDVVAQGLYASKCCGHERIFDKQEIFQRCPVCHCLCEWELEEITVDHRRTKQETAA